MLTKSHAPYVLLAATLAALSLIFIKLPLFRTASAITIGLSYFLWGLITHWKDKTLHLTVVLEYLAISLLAIVMLIFISLRA